MKKLLPLYITSILILIAFNQTGAFAGNTDFPAWISKLSLRISQTYQTPVKISSVREPDKVEKDAYFSFSVQGNGSFKQVPDPFETMHNLFLSDSWIANMRYDADGHGGSSFAYEKENRICLISVAIDSACDDTEKGHTPSKFWFTILCRERDKDQIP